MKLSKKLLITFAIVLGVILVSGVSVYAASNYGTKDDPLVTRSYIDSVKDDIVKQANRYADRAIDDLEDDFEDMIDAFRKEIEAKVAAGQVKSTSEVFTVVSLDKGQTLTLTQGDELLLQSGSATVNGEADKVFKDDTDNEDVDGGDKLDVNHMYTVAARTGTVTADSAVTLLVRGEYASDLTQEDTTTQPGPGDSNPGNTEQGGT